MGNDDNGNGNENEKNPQMTRMEVRGWSSVSTALIIYPQMLDRCYTDFHLFQICLTSVDCIGPQADGDVVSNCHE